MFNRSFGFSLDSLNSEETFFSSNDMSKLEFPCITAGPWIPFDFPTFSAALKISHMYKKKLERKHSMHFKISGRKKSVTHWKISLHVKMDLKTAPDMKKQQRRLNYNNLIYRAKSFGKTPTLHISPQKYTHSSVSHFSWSTAVQSVQILLSTMITTRGDCLPRTSHSHSGIGL